MGILNSTLRLQWSSLLWFALPLSPLPSQRPSPRPRLTPGIPMDMLATPTLTEPTEAMLATPTPTLASTTVTLDTALDTPMLTTERGLLMPSPRPMPMLSTDTTAMPGPMLTDTDTEATEATTGDK